jgi:two-component system cell cycle response regulator
LKILIADDDPVSSHLMRSYLAKRGFEVQVANDGEEALAALEAADGPRLALLDWMMPRLDGVALCRKLRASDDPVYRYLILVTSMDRTEDVIEGLEAGADDYITKPLSLPQLGARLHVGQRILQLHGELLATQETLRVQATRDVLTGLWNRRAIMETLGNEIERASREGSPMAVIMGDLDWFKKINDTHGHQGGDSVLREAAIRVANSVRVYDAVGRYGGEEILVVLPRCDKTQAMIVAERIRECVAAGPIDLGGANVTVTISLGVAVCNPGGLAVLALIKAADDALYLAKQNGRNRVEVARTTD